MNARRASGTTDHNHHLETTRTEICDDWEAVETWQRICGVGFDGVMHDIETEPEVSSVQLRRMWEQEVDGNLSSWEAQWSNKSETLHSRIMRGSVTK